MKLKFYGTAASEGVPAVFCDCENCRKMRELGGKNLRTRTSTQIDSDLLIDFSMDTFAHVLYGGLKLSDIHHCLITHSHIDHFFPNDMFAADAPKALLPDGWHLTVYGNDTVHQMWDQQAAKESIHLNDDRISFQELNLFDSQMVGDHLVTPLKADHAKGENCFLYLIEKDGKSLLYGHDTSYFPKQTWDFLVGRHLDCVVLDCTTVLSDVKYDPHMRFSDNVKIKEQMIEQHIASTHTVFIATHFVHTFILPHDELEKAMMPFGFIPAYDGMELEF